MEDNLQKSIAIFGGGCFWCTSIIFKSLKGVTSVDAGFSGGSTPDPTYEEVLSSKTGHIEVVRIEYDENQITYKSLLTVFFATHDPTSTDRQGADVGEQYRSIIFYTNPDQRKEAEMFIHYLDMELGQNIVVTKVEPFIKFYKAGEEHQDYYEKNQSVPYCQLVINPKLEKLHKEFSDLLKN